MSLEGCNIGYTFYWRYNINIIYGQFSSSFNHFSLVQYFHTPTILNFIMLKLSAKQLMWILWGWRWSLTMSTRQFHSRFFFLTSDFLLYHYHHLLVSSSMLIFKLSLCQIKSRKMKEENGKKNRKYWH